MTLENLLVIVKKVTKSSIQLETENGQQLEIPKSVLSDIKEGSQLYIAIDTKPLVSIEKHAKDVLNEIIKT